MPSNFLPSAKIFKTEKLAELKEQIRLNRKIEEESHRKQEDLARKLETLTKKFQLKFADKIDDYVC